MELLGHLNNRAINSNEWWPIKIGCRGPRSPFSLLMISYFLVRLLFNKWRWLKIVWRWLGLLRSREWIFKNLRFILQPTWILLSNRQYVLWLKCLKLSLLENIKKSQWCKDELLGIIRQSLSCRKMEVVSFSGWVILAKTVLSALPNYLMQSIYLFKSVCDKSDKRVRRFIWGIDMVDNEFT